MASVPGVLLCEDDVLVTSVRGGDVAAFETLVGRYQAPLVRYLVRQTGDPELAADLAQEALVAALRQIDRLDRDASFAAYLYGIAHNQLKMEWRRRRLRRLVSLDWLMEGSRGLTAASRGPGVAEASHERDAVQRVLDDIGPAMSQALLLHSSAGFTAPEVAEILGISLSAAEKRLSRAKHEFRARYSAAEGGKLHG